LSRSGGGEVNELTTGAFSPQQYPGVGRASRTSARSCGRRSGHQHPAGRTWRCSRHRIRRAPLL